MTEFGGRRAERVPPRTTRPASGQGLLQPLEAVSPPVAMKRATLLSLERPLLDYDASALCRLECDGYKRLLVVGVGLLIDECEFEAARGFDGAEGATNVEGVTFWRLYREPVIRPFNRVESKTLGPEPDRTKPLRQPPRVDEASEYTFRRHRKDLLKPKARAWLRFVARHKAIMTLR
jgi:hypothetical protein